MNSINKNKLYLIISILFVVISIILTNGFKGTYSAPIGDLGGDGDLYWAIDGNSCDNDNAGCTLKISNYPIAGNHYVNSKFYKNSYYSLGSAPWASYKYGISNVIVGGENDIITPTSLNSWFYNMYYLSSADLSHLDTSLVTDMSNVFYYTGYDAQTLKLDLSSWDTSNVKNMSYMFYIAGQNSKNIELDLSGWNTSNVTNMSYMFSCNGFYSNNYKLDLSGWNTSNVTNMSYMFYAAGYQAKTSNIIGLSDFNTSKVTNMSGMLEGIYGACEEFSLDLSGWNTSNVTNMSEMFNSVGEKATNFELNLSGWNTSKVTNMSEMFCNTASHSQSSELDLSNFDTSKVTNSTDMFYFSNGISKIKVGDKWNLKLGNFVWTKENDDTKYFAGDIPKNTAATYVKFYDEKYWAIDGDTLIISNNPVEGNVDFGVFNSADSVETSQGTWRDESRGDYLNVIKHVRVGGPDDIIKPYSVANWFFLPLVSEIDVSYIDTSLVTDMSLTFSSGETDTNVSSLTKIIGLDKWDTSNVIDMHGIFSANFILKELDLTGWDTSNVLDMSQMFYNNYELENIIGLENLNTYKVTNMSEMFYNCKKISELNLTGWNTSNVKNTSNMFFETNSLNKVTVGNNWTLQLGNYNWKNNSTGDTYTNGNIPKNIAATYLRDEIYWGISGGTLKISNNTLYGEYFGTIGSVSYPNWLDYYNLITNVQVGDVNDVISVNTLNSWFDGLNKVKTIDLTYLDTSKVTNMSYMFSGCESLTSLDLSNFDTRKVNNFYNMFWNTPNLEKIKVGENWNLLLSDSTWQNVKTGVLYPYGEISSFQAATYLKTTNYIYWAINDDTLTISNYEVTGNVTQGSLDINNPIYEQNSWLYDYEKDIEYPYIDVIKKVKIGDKNDIIKPYNMSNWFNALFKVKELDLTYLDTSNVIDMSFAFATGYCTDNGDESTCSSSLTKIIGLENLNTSNVLSMFATFGYNPSLKEIDISNLDLSNVYEMNQLFCDDYELENIKGLEDLNISNTYNINEIFYNCRHLTELDLSGWNTSNIEYSYGMFDGSSIKKIKVGDDWTLPLSEELWINEEIGEIYESGEIPENVEATYMRPIVYWAINDNKLTISNNYVEGNVDYGMLNTMEYIFDQNSWQYDYENDNEYPYNDIIKEVQIGGKDDIIKPYDMSEWFDTLYKIQELDLTYLDTSNTSSMSYAFSTGYCTNWEDDSTCSSALTSIIGLDKLNTSNIIYMNGTFGYNRSLKELDVSNLDTSNVESMSELFADDFELENIDVSNFDTSKVTRMTYMFKNCKNIKELDLSSFDTSNLEYINEMFYNCKHLTELDLSGWDTSNIEYIDDMFTNTNMLNKVKVGTNWNLPLSDNTWKNVETSESYSNGEIPANVSATYVKTNEQFYWMIDGDTLKVSNILDTNTNDYGAFDKDKSFMDYPPEESIPWLKYINQIKKVEFGSEEDILHPTNIDGWFAGLLNVEEIDVTYIDTSDVTSMVYTFSTMNCDDEPEVFYSSLKKIKGLEKFNTSKVENFNGMFARNIMLEELDLSSFDTSGETYCSSFEDEGTKNNCQSNMFGELSSLNEIKVGNKFDFVLPYSTWKNKETGTSYEEGIIPKNTAATYVRDMYYWTVNNDTLIISNNEVTGSTDNGMFSEFSYNKPWTKYYKDIKNIIVGENNNIVKPAFMIGWFANLPYLENVDVTNFDTSVLETAEELYSNSDNIKKIIVGDKWTLLLTDDDWYNEETDEMYENGEIPENTKATYIRPIIYYIANEYECMNTNKCVGIISNNPIYGKNMINIPVNTLYPIMEQLPLEEIGSVVTEIQVGGPDDIIKPYNMNGMFAYLSNIKKIDLQYLDTSKATDMSGLFFNDYSLESIDVSNFDTRNVENMASMFSVTEKCEDSGCTFGSDTLKEIKGLNKFNTSNVTDMSGMFMGQGGIETIDVSSFDTLKVESMADMFECAKFKFNEMILSNLKEIKGLENFDTSNVENYMNMFAGDNILKELDLTGFNTSNESFCSLLDDEEEKNECYSSMFIENNSLSKVKVGENWNLTLMDDTWVNEETKDVYEEGIISKNVKATYIRPIIYYIANEYECMNTNKCKLTISNYPIYDENMINFPVNTLYPIMEQLSLEGTGSVVTEIQVGGPDDIIKPYYMAYMFAYLSNIKKIDLQYLDTSNATDMSDLFFNDYLLESIDVSNFDTSKVEDMTRMFAIAENYKEDDYTFGSNKLKEIKGLNKFNTSNVYDMTGMFMGQGGIETIDVSSFDTSKVESMAYMFECLTASEAEEKINSNLKEIKGLENFDTTNVENYEGMFAGDIKLQELDLSNFNTSNDNFCSLLDNEEEKNECYSFMFMEDNSLSKVKVGENWNFPLSNNRWINESTGEIYENGNIPKNVSATYVRTMIYWAVDDNKLILSSKKVDGNVDSGVFDSTISFLENNLESKLPWQKYLSKIKYVQVGGNDDILKPTYMDLWFAGLSNVEEIDVSNIDTSNVISMVGTLVTYNESSEYGYSSLKRIIGLENFDTSKVENFNAMFNGNIMLEELDLSSFDTSGEMYCSDFVYQEAKNNCQRNMFGELSGLKEIKVGDKFDFELPYGTWTNKETGVSYVSGGKAMFPKNISATYVRDMYYWALNHNTLTISNDEITGITDSGMFSEYSYLKPWSKYYEDIKNIIVGDSNSIVKPTYMDGWFANLPYLENIDVSYLDTSSLEDYEDLFYNSDSIKKITVGNKWNLQLTEANWYNEETGDMYELGEIPENTASTYIRPVIFYIIDRNNCTTKNCVLTISNNIKFGDNIINYPVDTYYPIIDQVPLEDIGTDITEVNVGGPDDIIKPYNMNGMFAELYRVKNIDLTYLNTSNSIDMSNLFLNTYALESIDVSNFDTSKVTNMDQMFGFTPEVYDNGATLGSDKLKEIKGLENFDTTNVETMSEMFMGQGGLETIDVSSFNTSKVENMSYMFECAKGLANGYEVKFESKLKEIKGLENFDTSNVENYMYMFALDNNLKELNLSGFNTENENFCNLLDDEEEKNECFKTTFEETFGLSKITVSENWDFPLSYGNWINEETGEMYVDGEIPENTASTYIRPVIFWAINNKTLTLSNSFIKGNVDYGTYDTGFISSYGFDVPWYEYLDDIKYIKVGGPDDIIKPYNMFRMFSGLTRIREIDLTYLDTSNTYDMTEAFSFSGFETIDVSNFDTSNVISMEAMFMGDICDTPAQSKLKEIKGLENFDTSHVKHFSYMFEGNANLKELDLSSFDTSNAEICLVSSQNLNMNHESFVNGVCSSNPNMNHDTKVNISNEYDYSCSSNIFGIYTISLQKIKVGNKFTLDLPYDYNWINEESGEMYEYGVTNVAATYIRPIVYWAVDDDTLILSSNPVDGNIDFGEYDTGFNSLEFHGTPWEEYEDNIKNIKVGGLNDFVKPYNMNDMFAYLPNVKEIDLTYLDTSITHDMIEAFAYSGFETIDVSNFNTSKVEEMNEMFVGMYSCEKSSKPIESVESNVSSTACITSQLKEIKGLTSFDTSNVKDFSFMFEGNANLKELDLSSFDTSNTEICGIRSSNPNMSHETKVNDVLICTYSIFGYDLYSLQKVKVGDKFTLDLPKHYNWINDKTGEMYEEGDIPENVAATYIRPIVYWAVDDDTLILSSNPVEGNVDFGEYDTGFNSWEFHGTPWEAYEYNIKDIQVGGQNDIIKPYNMVNMFSYLENVKEIDLQYLDTSNVIDMSYLFSRSGFEIIDVSNFDTSNVLYMQEMFAGNTCVNSTKPINDIESNVSTTACITSQLKEIKGLENFDTSNVEYFENMFISNQYLRELDLSSFDTSNVNMCPDGSINPNMNHDTKVNVWWGYDCGGDLFGQELYSLQKVKVGDKFTLYLPNWYNWINEETGEMYEHGDIPENIAATYIRPLVYWAVDDDTLILSSNPVEGNVDFGMVDTADIYWSQWNEYNSQINKIIVGSEDDIIKPYNMISWFHNFTKVKELDLTNVDSSILISVAYIFNNMTSLEKLNMKSLDLSKIDYCYLPKSSNPSVNTHVRNSEIENSGCDIFYENNNLREISLSKNNVRIVRESLENPSSEYITGATGVWYSVDGEAYDASELPEEDATYYALKPHKVTYNVDGVDPQAKLPGEDLTLYDEIIKESKIEEITTSFDTSINEVIVDVTTGVEESSNELDDIISLKITTYTLKNFTDKDKNIYLPGSIYTIDEDLELDVNYDEEVHYNSIELPIPVKHGYKFEYWTLDGKKISEYTPKTNKTLVAVWSEIKHSFIDDEIEYEKESSGLVIFETDGIIENFKNLYVNGKKLELGKDYVIDENKIILTNDGIEYLDSLEPGEYEVKAEFSDSNSDVYGIIKISEKEEPQEEPEDEPKDEPDNPKEEPKDEPQDNPIIPKTSDYILFTIIIAITALLSSIFIYKKIEY